MARRQRAVVAATARGCRTWLDTHVVLRGVLRAMQALQRVGWVLDNKSFSS